MKLKNTKGSSMVSAVVAFLLLMMGIAMLTTVVYASADSIRGVTTIRKKTDKAMENYFLGKSEGTAVYETPGLVLSDSAGMGFKVDANAYAVTEDGFTVYYFDK